MIKLIYVISKKEIAQSKSRNLLELAKITKVKHHGTLTYHLLSI